MPGVRPGALLGHTPGLWTPPASGPAVFSPLSLSPAFWYDFSQLAGADGSAISSIPDLSANARTASQATGIKQPLVKAGVNGINGLKVGLFDGVQTVLTTAAFTIAQPMVVYAVITGGGAGPQRFWSSADASLSVRTGFSASPDGPSNFAGLSLAATSGVAANPKVMTSVFNGASSLIRINGVQIVVGDTGAGTVSNGIAIGAALSAQFWGGKIGELLGHPGSTVSTAYEASLKTKWGTP